MTNSKPIFQYHISGLNELLIDDSPFLQLPLMGKGAEGILIHEYFELAKKFIQASDYGALREGVKFILNRACSVESFEQIDIYLEKHGAFYHPARIEVSIKNTCKPTCKATSYRTSEITCETTSESNVETTPESNVEPNSEITLQDTSPVLFVLNTAVSIHGLALIDNEYHLLKYLNQIDGNFFLPRVFGMESMICREMPISFFLATWFDGYKEFHLTDNLDKSDNLDGSDHFDRSDNLDRSDNIDISDLDKSNIQKLHLWNSDGSVIPVSLPAYFEIYEKASEILTFFYNINTFEQISPWHHAAGDFVVKSTEQGFDVKLITARGYSAIVESGCPEATYEIDEDKIDEDEIDGAWNNNIQDIYKALLLFFLNLTLRMRIDRIDGTGERCLVDDKVIPFILKGFFRAIGNKKIVGCSKIGDREKTDSNETKGGSEKIPDNIERNLSNNPDFSKNMIDGFKSYLMQFSHENLYEILLVMTDDYHPDSPETLFIRNNLKHHSERLFCYICNNIP
ncbi:MAG: hypothetical protein HQK67_08240 [Desulfamplus sp.]|nr:hypothetical protein [Desulfamplus sp.]